MQAHETVTSLGPRLDITARREGYRHLIHCSEFGLTSVGLAAERLTSAGDLELLPVAGEGEDNLAVNSLALGDLLRASSDRQVFYGLVRACAVRLDGTAVDYSFLILDETVFRYLEHQRVCLRGDVPSESLDSDDLFMVAVKTRTGSRFIHVKSTGPPGQQVEVVLYERGGSSGFKVARLRGVEREDGGLETRIIQVQGE